MRYEAKHLSKWWILWDSIGRIAMMSVSERFPEAEQLVRSQAAFLNESPAMEAA